MNEETLRALRASIAHHETNRDNPKQASTGPSECALCRLFFDDARCNDACPVKQKTGKDHCEGSPYNQVFQTRSDYSFARRWGQDTTDSVRRFKEAEQAEIDFLKSLLPDGANDGEKPSNNA